MSLVCMLPLQRHDVIACDVLQQLAMQLINRRMDQSTASTSGTLAVLVIFECCRSARLSNALLLFRMLGHPPNVAIPTHFFKVVLCSRKVAIPRSIAGTPYAVSYLQRMRSCLLTASLRHLMHWQITRTPRLSLNTRPSTA